MPIKIIGALLIVAGSGCFGIALVASYKAEVKTLRQLITVLVFMKNELQYRLTPLPQLCRQTAAECSGIMRELFLVLSTELEGQIMPDVSSCMNVAVAQCENLPKKTVEYITQLGQTLGHFDLQGQMSGLESVRQACIKKLESMEMDKETRLRSYQTLCLCAGAALAILLI